MEQRKPPRTRAKRRPVPVLLIGLLGCGLLLGGVAFFSAVGPPNSLSSRGDTSHGHEPTVAGTPAGGTDAVGGSAMIVDEADPDPLGSIGGGPSAATDGTAPGVSGASGTGPKVTAQMRATRRAVGSMDRQRVPGAPGGAEPDLLTTLLANIGNDPATTISMQGARTPGGGSADGSTGTTGAARSGPPSADRNRRQGGAARVGEPDLIATLMRNIGGSQGSGAPAARGQGDSELDALVTQIQNNRDENYAPSATALSTIGGGTAASTTGGVRSVQAELSHCPKANTVAGLACRQRICMDHVGNAACPR